MTGCFVPCSAADRQRGIEAARQAVEHARAALRAMADHVRDDSDRGALAAYNQFMLRVVEQGIESWRGRLEDGDGSDRP